MEKKKNKPTTSLPFITGCLVLNSQNHRDSIVWPKHLMPKFDVKVMIWLPALFSKVHFFSFCIYLLVSPLRRLKIYLSKTSQEQTQIKMKQKAQASIISHAWVHCWGKWQKTGPKGIKNIPQSCVQCRLSWFFTVDHWYFPHIIYFMHYVLVLALCPLDKSAPLVSSNRLAATGFSMVDSVISHTAGRMGLLCIVKVVMDRMQRFTK